MTAYSPIDLLDARADAPVGYRPNRAERVFDLHPAVFAMQLACYAAFLAILGLAFMNRELVVPFGIFVVYVAMYFATPAMWARVKGRAQGRLESWAEFMEGGVQTGSGHLTGGQALAQIMTVPLLLVGFAGSVAVIAAIS